MITISRISDVRYEEYDEVWAIVRSMKYGNPHVKHVPELSPSWPLFGKYRKLKADGQWNEGTFKGIYVSEFLNEMKGKRQRELLNELFATKKDICLVCFCEEEWLCHRCIIGGMLQGAGLEVKGLSRDYSFYFDWYRNGVPDGICHRHAVGSCPDDIKGAVYPYRAGRSVDTLFQDGLPAMCFTGRRPKDLCGYDPSRYVAAAEDLSELIYEEFYMRRGIRRFITGAAQGFDQLSFWAVYRMANAHGCMDVQNVVFLPFQGFESRWADIGCFSKADFGQMLHEANKVVVLSDKNGVDALFERNHAMCRCAGTCLALYPDDGWSAGRGGTAECMRYAKDVGIKLLQLKYVVDTSGALVLENSPVQV